MFLSKHLKDQLFKASVLQFDQWFFGPEKFSGLSRNRPLLKPNFFIFEEQGQFRQKDLSCSASQVRCICGIVDHAKQFLLMVSALRIEPEICFARGPRIVLEKMIRELKILCKQQKVLKCFLYIYGRSGFSKDENQTRDICMR